MSVRIHATRITRSFAGSDRAAWRLECDAFHDATEYRMAEPMEGLELNTVAAAFSRILDRLRALEPKTPKA